jgi:hypothetical protein
MIPIGPSGAETIMPDSRPLRKKRKLKFRMLI